MTFIRRWRDYLPTMDRPTMLAVAAVSLVAIACLFLGTLTLRQFLDKRGLKAEIAHVEQSLAEAKELQKKKPGELREEIAAAQATLAAALKDFISEAESVQEVDKIYQYASENQVQIVSLQAQPTPQEGQRAYDVKQFQLQATGSLPQLTDFLGQIEEAIAKNTILTDVSIVESEGAHTLSASITMYTTSLPKATPVAGDLAELQQKLNDAWAAEDWEEAIGLIRSILSIDPNYDEMTEKLYAAHVKYGYKLLGEGNPDGATAQFNSALEIKPGGEEALAGLQQAATWVSTPVATPSATPVPTVSPTPPGTPTPTPTVEEPLPTPTQPQYIIHVVQPGENLYRISLRYGTTVQAIMAANGLTNYTIYVGQRLRIPVQ